MDNAHPLGDAEAEEVGASQPEAVATSFDNREAICLDQSRSGRFINAPRGRAPEVAQRQGAAAEPHVPSLTEETTTEIDTPTSSVVGNGEREACEDERFFEAVVAATASTNMTAASPTPNDRYPSLVGRSRFASRKAPMTPAVRYIMQAMCTDLVACGECFVPDFMAGQTLVRFCGFVPFRLTNDSSDAERRRFLGGAPLGDGEGEAYGRGVGLPGLAWQASKPSVVEISALTSDASFDCGGTRMAEAGRLFHTAMTVPLYLAADNNHGSRWGQQLMGVVVVYFQGPEKAASTSALVAYASAVAMHHKLHEKTKTEATMNGVEASKLEVGLGLDPFASLPSGAASPTTASRASASRHELRSETSKRAIMLVVQARRRLANDNSGGDPARAWLKQYFAKSKGGRVNLPVRANPRDAFVTWVGTFAAIGCLELMYDAINRSSSWGAQEDVFVLSGSFGALATLIFAIPGTPLAQPRIMLGAHTLAVAFTHN
eukprot:g13902.t1